MMSAATTPEQRQITGASRPLLVTVVGQGYVGLPLSVAIAASGHSVQAVEADPKRLGLLQRRASYIVDVTDADLERVTAIGTFRPVGTIAETEPADIYLIAVSTPVTAGGRPDLRYLDEAIANIAQRIQPGALIIIESTVYPGATRQHIAPELERLTKLQVGVHIHVAYSPQRIDPGRDESARCIPKLLAGLDEYAALAAAEFYLSVYDAVVTVSSCEVAEFAKLYENTFRYVNVAFANELAKAAHAMSIDFREVSAAAATKPFGFMPFRHGPGVGGHCLPNNVRYLEHALAQVGAGSTVMSAARSVNESMPRYIVERLRTLLADRGKSIEGASILVLGLSYKGDVADTRGSSTYPIVELISAAGAEARVADPHVGAEVVSDHFTLVELSEVECRSSDAVLLVTDHAAFDYDLIIENSPVVLDCRGRFSSTLVEQL